MENTEQDKVKKEKREGRETGEGEGDGGKELFRRPLYTIYNVYSRSLRGGITRFRNKQQMIKSFLPGSSLRYCYNQILQCNVFKF